MPIKFDADYWTNRYSNGETGWDIGSISTPLKEYIDQLRPKNISILIPGCGNAHEAAYLLEKGFTNITLIDIAPALTKQIALKFKDALNNGINIVTGDFFEYSGKFDLILEQTFLSAIPPERRSRYAPKMAALLKQKGKIAGLLFNHNFEKEGPPFGGSLNEYRILFSTLFEIKTLAPAYNSISPRAGTECFFIVQKRC